MGTGPWRVPDALLSPNPPAQMRRMRNTVVSGEIEEAAPLEVMSLGNPLSQAPPGSCKGRGATLHILCILFVTHGLGISAISPEA